MGNFNSFKNDRSGGDRGFGGGGRSSYGDRDRGSRPSYGGGRDSGSRSSYGGGRSDGPKKMFPATCDGCNEKCEVPFRPSGTQPVYCSNCFKSQKGGDSFSSRKPERSFEKSFGGAPSASASQSSGVSQKQLDSLHLKMDKILSLLESGKKAPLFEKSSKKEKGAESTQGGSVVSGEKPVAKKKAEVKADKKAEKKEKKTVKKAVATKKK
ncbi:MAG: hypothetical protein CO029_02050 [Candidatus Magasanikbacteria bacterium CG_4_9_14_0_2_um_filter_41_10]|uniref:CxxC-x17-CxxC domain-containing protein n=1 Tax=Candidatus Magasanikbacteria bacterium CG_4_10_14_0_2_um_filter_41_31 TaxID=1974639 RepID=A0A2M7V5V0_9BACT|nr:MAG: hypothetical protein AUJ37_00305 [Candidatus Magasanikbacteria bacterium CG1_02_41_34]PIZ93993.1 MAG: hypothetical protein COX83_00385 [Candidatus Magasanikbacteria bacterium CG_4_10_14_0_2_um_filter_41_31]PJC53583.1 MAG: hypothetical protein CO029_02050 [Candidatus Magasanikbacteria bacterium CG_4_9_14_0_2_um_filter_41_10]